MKAFYNSDIDEFSLCKRKIFVSVKYRPRIFKFPGLCDNPPDVRN
jgi:hypothetical protein